MFYKGTIDAVLKSLGAKGESREYILNPGEGVPLPHLRWMCQKVQQMDTTSIEEAIKAASWVGWICAHMELRSFWPNSTSRDLIRMDKQSSLHLPH